jgi:hypothetical protein
MMILREQEIRDGRLRERFKAVYSVALISIMASTVCTTMC